MTISATGASARVRMLRETTFGTAAVGNYFNMPFSPPVDIGSTKELLDDPLLGQGRDPLDPEYGAENASGSLNVPVDLNYFGLWLSGLLGDAVSTPDDEMDPTYYDHVFTSGGIEFPSFSIEVGHPRLNKWSMNTGHMVNSMGISFARDGQAIASIGTIGQKEVWAGASGAGVPASLDLERFSQFQTTLKRNGADMGSVLSASMNFTNNFDPVGPIGNQGLIDGLDDGVAACTGEIEIRFRDDTLLQAAISGTPMALEFGFVKSATEFLKFSLPRVFLPKPRTVIPGPGGVNASFSWSAKRDPILGYAMRATLRNALDGTIYGAGE